MESGFNLKTSQKRIEEKLKEMAGQEQQPTKTKVKESTIERLARLAREADEKAKEAKRRLLVAERKIAEQKRKDDTRKKIINSGVVFQMIKDGEFRYTKEEWLKILDEKLTNERDRKLFNLE